MLRFKPVRRRVPSTLLWGGVVKVQVATSPFQRLRRSLSLLLMLLLLACLVLALAGLRAPRAGSRGLPLVVVIDLTAGMQAKGPGGSRLEIAKRRARRIIEATRGPVTLLVWDGAMRPGAPPEARPALALRALEQLRASDYGAPDNDLLRALKPLLEGDSGKRVVLVSDHQPGSVSRDLWFVPAGSALENVGIVAASLTEVSSLQTDLFFGIEYTGTRARRLSVVLEYALPSGEMELVDAKEITLEPGRRTAVTFEDVKPGLYRGRLRGRDALELDNVAWVRYPKAKPQDVVLRGNVPEPLRRAIQAIEASMGVTRLLVPGSEEPSSTAYVFADAASSGVRPTLPAVFIAPLAKPEGVEYGEPYSAGSVAARPVRSFLWRGAGVPRITLRKTGTIVTTRYLRPVLQAERGPAIGLLARGEVGGELDPLSDLVLAFVPGTESGTFQETYAFVIFWANWFSHVRRLRDPLPRGAVSTSDRVEVMKLKHRGEFSYRRLDGDGPAVAGVPGQTLKLERTGRYRFEGLVDTELAELGVSLLDPGESNTARVSSVGFDATEFLAELNESGEGVSDLDLRPWLALAAGLLLLFEWFWYRRAYPVGRTKAEG